MNELLASFDNYLIYKVNSKKTKTYYLCVPSDDTLNYQMFLGFPDVDLSKLSKEELIGKIKEVNDVILSINDKPVYVLPDIPVSHLEEAALENDNPYYNKILRETIQPITSEIYEMLITANHGKKKMNRTINVIKKNDMDKKFAGWLSMRLGEENIKEIDFNKLCERLSINDEIFIDYTPTSSDYQDKNTNQENQKDNNIPVKKLTSKKRKIEVSPGFSNFKFIVGILLFSLVGVVVAAALLIK